MPGLTDQILGRIAFVGSYLPRQCGIATFTADLRAAIEQLDRETLIVPINDRPEGYDYASPVRFTIDQNDMATYRRAAQFLDMSRVDVVSLQHEYGIYGGLAGSHVLALLSELRTPVVTTLHTVLKEPDDDYREVTLQLARLSDRLVVMSRRGEEFLREVYGIPANKIDFIPHGIPDMPFVDPNFYKDQFDVAGRLVLLSFGLLGPNKGIEHVVGALPRIQERYPGIIYLVVGATHPHWLREQGEEYRLGLQRQARELGVSDKVVFYNHFVEVEELKDFIGASDVYLTPYVNEAQITSGTLAQTVGAGKAVVSTPYWYATELLDEGRGLLVPFADSAAIAEAVIGLFEDDARRHAMRKRAYLHGREMTWPVVAQQYMESFLRARDERASIPRSVRAEADGELRRGRLPEVSLDHLRRMTDSTGLLQHAKFSIPDYSDGYSTDDNARALLLTVRLRELGETPNDELEEYAARYLAFVLHAYNRARGRFRNFMGYDHVWTEDVGSEDCHGRVLWALGVVAGGLAEIAGMHALAGHYFDDALPPAREFQSLRAWAFTLLGLNEYLRWFTGDFTAREARKQLALRLADHLRQVATDDWCWFEDRLTYCNARLPQALIVTGHATGDDELTQLGLKSLSWLADLQRSEGDHFVPIGCNGFYVRGGQRARFDQQPVEAMSMVSASLDAARITGQSQWREEALRAFEWFLGRNDLGVSVCDTRTGACYDGLHPGRVNANQGAEATLSYLLAVAEMRLADQVLRKSDVVHDTKRTPPNVTPSASPEPDPVRG